MNTIAPSLRETTSLLYLSGCKTASAGFAVAAAQYGVPAVLGFRWKVQDKPAEQHARLFYHQLFREKAIDKAFRNTRRGMRLLNRKDNAWASGMLVMASQ
jgi:CHAT domain-containing protein